MALSVSDRRLAMLYAAKDVQAADDRVCGVRVVRLARRRQRRAVLHVRPAQSRARGVSGRCCGGSATISASSRSSSTAAWSLYAADAAHDGRARRQHPSAAVCSACWRPTPCVAARLRGQRRDTGVRRRHVVDGAERRLAARQRAAHPVQHDVGPAARPGDGRHLRRRPHGDHLHDRGRRRVPAEQHGGRCIWGMPIPFLRGAHVTLGASAPIFGLLGALVHYGRRGGSSMVGGQAMQYAIMLFVFGLIMPAASTTTRTPAALPADTSRRCGSIRSSRERMDHSWAPPPASCLTASRRARCSMLVTSFTRCCRYGSTAAGPGTGFYGVLRFE